MTSMFRRPIRRNSGINFQGAPWLIDPAWTNTWTFDAANVTIATGISNLAATKGGLALTQGTGANQPAFASTWGPGNRGCGVFDGAASYLSGDSLSSLVAGTQLPFTMMYNIEPTAALTTGYVWAFAYTLSAAQRYHASYIQSTGSVHSQRAPDVGAQVDLGTTQLLTAGNRYVLTLLFTGIACTIRVNGAVSSVNGTAQSVSAMNPNTFTVGAIKNTAVGTFGKMKIRSLLFSNTLVASNSYTAAENYMMAEN